MFPEHIGYSRSPIEKRILTTMKKPDHLEKFPCMHPWIGNSYRDDRHKRLLVIGESHYMPPKSTIHLGPDLWYRSNEGHLSEEERRWVHTCGVISSKTFHRGHEIFRAIKREIVGILKESGLTPDDFPLNHIAYYNYFMRPASKTGGSIEGHVVPQDCKISEDVLRWFIRQHQPEMMIFTSQFASGKAEGVIREYGIPCISTPHPGCSWWNRSCPKYNRNPIYAGDTTRPRRGRDLFRDFLKKSHWITTTTA